MFGVSRLVADSGRSLQQSECPLHQSSKARNPLTRISSPAEILLEGEPLLSPTQRKLESEGKLTGSQKLSTALEAWKTQGLSGLRALVEKGLAPAVLLSLFAASQSGEPVGRQGDL